MPKVMPFIVIIERSARQALLSAALLGTALSASAQTNSTKIARDLQPVLTAGTTPVINWARDINGRRYVKVLIVSNSDDAELAALRSAVMSAGGSIYYRYSSVLALAALVPADKVGGLAARSDVQSISPNRLMTRSASTVESVTGTAAVRNTGTSSYSSISGYSGRGIGIAVLDDRRGLHDIYGREMKVTLINRADSIATAATLVMGETTEKTPAALVRGFPQEDSSQTARDVIRPLEEDMFR